MIHRVWKSLNPGGLLAIHEYVAESSPALYDAAFRLTLLTETGTRMYTFEELSDWLTEAGFASITSETLVGADKGKLILARKQV